MVNTFENVKHVNKGNYIMSTLKNKTPVEMARILAESEALIHNVSLKLHSTFIKARKLLYEAVKKEEILASMYRYDVQFPLLIRLYYRNRMFTFYIANADLLILNTYFDSILDREWDYEYRTGKPVQSAESLSYIPLN